MVLGCSLHQQPRRVLTHYLSDDGLGARTLQPQHLFVLHHTVGDATLSSFVQMRIHADAVLVQRKVADNGHLRVDHVRLHCRKQTQLQHQLNCCDDATHLRVQLPLNNGSDQLELHVQGLSDSSTDYLHLASEHRTRFRESTGVPADRHAAYVDSSADFQDAQISYQPDSSSSDGDFHQRHCNQLRTRHLRL